MNKFFLLATVIATLLLGAGCKSTSESCSCCTPAETASGSTFSTVMYGTNKVHYVVKGRGDHTIVFVHCWSGNLSFWDEQVAPLEKKAKLVFLDLPGHGQSDKPQTAYTMDFLAGAVLAVMKDAHVHKATLIGHSMGTPVICRVYHQAPDKVAGLVAVDGMLRRPAIPADRANQLMAAFHSPEYQSAMTNMVQSMFPNPATVALRDHVLSEMLKTPQYVMAGAMDGMFGADQPDWDPKKVDVPVMVINATNPMWDEDYRNYVHGLSPNTDYRAIEGTGHWVMLEKPSEFNADLVEMLAKFDLIAK